MIKYKTIAIPNTSEKFSTHLEEPIKIIMDRIIGASLDKSKEYLKACQDIIKSKVTDISTYNLEGFNGYDTVQNALTIQDRLSRCGHNIPLSLAKEILNALPKKPFETALETLTSDDLKLLNLTREGDYYTSPFCEYKICSQDDLGEYLGDYFSKTDNPDCLLAKKYIRTTVANATVTDKTNPHNKVNGTEFDCWLIDQEGNKLGRLILTKTTTPEGLINLEDGTHATLAYRNSGVATRLYNHMLQSNFTIDVNQGSSGFAKENAWLFHVKLKELLDLPKNSGKKESDLYEQALLDAVPSAKLWYRNGFNPSSIALNNGFLEVVWKRK